MKIFSYGSNMSSRRLAARVPSARFLGSGYVTGYTLRFHKRGRLDDSGKANMFRTGSPKDRVWGVIWKIDPAHKPDLDHVEGLGAGYEEERVGVRVGTAAGGGIAPETLAEVGKETVTPTPNGRAMGADLVARAYIASPDYIDDRLLPYGWYLDFVLAGAREHGLPESYVAEIARQESERDPDRERRRENRRVLGRGRGSMIGPRDGEPS